MFFSPEEVRKARLRGKVEFKIADLDRSLFVVSMVAARALEGAELNVALKSGTIKQSVIFRTMIMNACVDENGDLLDEASAIQLVEVLTLAEVVELAGIINKSMAPPTGADGAPAFPSEGSPVAG